MKPVRAAAIAAAAAAVSALAACDHHQAIAGPSGLLYACADGRALRVFYDGGDPNRAQARLQFEGREFALAPAPAMSGLRYISTEGISPGRGLAWSAEGDEAVLAERALDPAAAEGEREIVRCTRVREDAVPAADRHGAAPDDH